MISESEIIYFDNNSTTQTDKRVVLEMLNYFSSDYYNPNSDHVGGKRVLNKINSARKTIANHIGADADEIIFTSGSTEGVNYILKGIVENLRHKGNHIITSTIEHSAVINTLKYLENIGFSITWISPNKDGCIDINDVIKSKKKETILVAIMGANNETGVIQPFESIGDFCYDNGIYFFSDFTQIIGKVKIDLSFLKINSICFSGHKIYGPKGIGVLYQKKKTDFEEAQPLLFGGPQERGLRAGTLNVPGIIGLSKAISIFDAEMNKEIEKIKKLRSYLEDKLINNISNSYIHGFNTERLCNTVNICFPGIDGKIFIQKLKKVACSNGSACNSMVIEPSPVLLSMGVSENDANSSIRFSLGRFNDSIQIDNALIHILEILK
jgi:cysteine desulfurase